MDKAIVWMVVALLELGVIILSERKNRKLRDALTETLLENLSDNEFLSQISYDSETDLVKQINQKYAIGLGNALKVARAFQS